MANEKIVKLDHLNIVKNYIDSKDSDSIKSAEYADNTIKLYNTIDMSGEAAVTLSLKKCFLIKLKRFSYRISDGFLPHIQAPKILILTVNPLWCLRLRAAKV